MYLKSIDDPAVTRVEDPQFSVASPHDQELIIRAERQSDWTALESAERRPESIILQLPGRYPMLLSAFI